ncbi:Methyltransferase domain protein [Pelotomaculum schinkii]|uniref:Methyltransferase domain protein n=1 Tax=Pelotomaculum schinkii TaxID=78350 RepID=A0A4Y7RGK6_9FIRM|nr:methyltransferase domain-containing protein [Pelotomaculum schinkii]TEB07946.1 Methyltransferase domain protein [Pelotomaculum schinkii]
MKYTKSGKYDSNYIKENIMGPNPIKLLEELLALHSIPQNATVLDLGCGRGVTSVFMVKEYSLRVFATDLWVSATDNKTRFDDLGLTSEQIIPIHAEAHSLPYAEEFFDAVVSIDSYHYFGRDEKYLGKHLLPLVKHGGYLLFAVPGLKKDIHANLPPEMLLSWTAEDIETLHDTTYWRKMLEITDGIEIISVCEMESFDECWNDWLVCDNKYAVNDRKSMNAGAGKYMNFIAIIIRRK